MVGDLNYVSPPAPFLSFVIQTSCSFNIVKPTVNERWCLIGMLDAGVWINDRPTIDPNGANEACK